MVMLHDEVCKKGNWSRLRIDAGGTKPWQAWQRF